MAQDKSNIFKLDKKEFKEYEKAPFNDCFKSIELFGVALKNDIETKETPHVLLLDADYGMGKTFFVTRFTQYLRNNKIDTIYFSAWDNDYMPEAFISFTKEIIGYINKKYKASKWKTDVLNLFSKIEDVVSATSISFCDVQISSAELIKAFKKETDPIIEFKKELKKFIKKIPNNKLVIIVDELDRCRPDYAMKILECIKHFFDIEGLFIVIPTNKEALHDSTTALFGIDKKTIHKECYFKKFFNDERKLKAPTVKDYEYILKQYINKDKLKIAIDRKLINEDGDNFNSINTLLLSLAKYAHNANLSIRDTKDIANETTRICCHFYEPVRTEWLSCLMAYKYKDKNYPFTYPLPADHCFYEENRSSQNQKKILLMLNIYKSCFTKLKHLTNYNFGSYDTFYSRSLVGLKECQRDLTTYGEASLCLENKEKLALELSAKYPDNNDVQENVVIIRNGIKEQRAEITNYQNKFGSDEEDESRKSKYESIVFSPENLYLEE